MDITSTTTAQVSATPDTGAAKQAQQSSKSDSSFKDEMSKVSTKEEAKTEEKAEAKTESKAEAKTDSKTETKTAEQNAEKVTDEQSAVAVKTEEMQNIKMTVIEDQNNMHSELASATMLSGSVDMSAFQNVNSAFTPETQALIDANMQLSELVSDAKVPTKVDYSIVQMDMNDTKFFTDLVQNTDKTMQNVMAELTQGAEAEVQEVQKNIRVSQTLMNALSEAVKNKQSFRIDFDKDISVIIRVDKDGALTARFIPGDSAVEQYLKQNISTLRQRFDDQELPYKELSYSGQQKRERKNNENNKENGNE